MIQELKEQNLLLSLLIRWISLFKI
jgi:hypothetical protein